MVDGKEDQRSEIESNFPKAALFSQFIRNIYPMTGTIKRVTDKGFGFITPDGGEKDIFFHSSALVGVTFAELQVGEKVSFETEDSEKGPRAKNVSRA